MPPGGCRDVPKWFGTSEEGAGKSQIDPLITITMTPYFHDTFISKHLKRKLKKKIGGGKKKM